MSDDPAVAAARAKRARDKCREARRCRDCRKRLRCDGCRCRACAAYHRKVERERMRDRRAAARGS